VPVLTSGCVGYASSSLPPFLSFQERTRLKEQHLPYTVGVQDYKHPAYSEHLLKRLHATKIFDRVDKLQNFTNHPPTLVARVNRQIYGSTQLPFATLGTGGIIPMFAQEEHGVSFSLSTHDNPDCRVFIEY